MVEKVENNGRKLKEGACRELESERKLNERKNDLRFSNNFLEVRDGSWMLYFNSYDSVMDFVKKNFPSLSNGLLFFIS